MPGLNEYVDRKLALSFARAVPLLREQFGQRPAGVWGNSYGVAGNTFRALGGYNERPSPVYREWAARQVSRLNAEALQERVGSRDAFLSWHRSMVRSLQRHWRSVMGSPLSFAHSHKLVDLFVKWLAHFDFGSQNVTELIVTHANCALDRQTLRKLNACLSHALPMPNPAMGDVQCEATYRFCQAAVTEFAEVAGGSRLLFDAFAWRRGG